MQRSALTPQSEIRWAMRKASVCVFPEPAPALINKSRSSGARTAARC